MSPIEVSCKVFKTDVIIRMGDQPSFKIAINILHVGNRNGSRISVEEESAGYNTKSIFLIGTPVHSQLQGLVEVPEFEACLLVGISFHQTVRSIDLVAVQVHGISSAEEIRIIITK